MSNNVRQIELLPPDQIRPNPRNPRRHSREQIRAIADSIQAFGFNAPILIDRSNQVIAGHGRLAAATDLRIPEVPVVRLENLSDEQARAYMLADNKLTDRSNWDLQSLAIHLKELSELSLEFNLEATGFTVPEIDIHIQSLQNDTTADEAADDFEISSQPPVTRIGDLWHLGDHRLFCGDALDAASYQAVLGADQANASFTDMPYNLKIKGHVSGRGRIKHEEFAMASGELDVVAFTGFLTTAFKHLRQNVKAGALVYGCMDFRHCQEILTASGRAGFDLLNLCVWAKTNGGMGTLYRSQHELIWVFRNGPTAHRNNIQLGRFGRNRTNLWTYPGANVFSGGKRDSLLKLHPTVKPVALVADAILDCTAPGELIIDPFLGSGTTLLAAERTRRRAAGIELSPVFLDTAILRWQKQTRKEARHACGQTFAEISVSRFQNQ